MGPVLGPERGPWLGLRTRTCTVAFDSQRVMAEVLVSTIQSAMSPIFRILTSLSWCQCSPCSPDGPTSVAPGSTAALVMCDRSPNWHGSALQRLT